jgi:hypothetical protein
MNVEAAFAKLSEADIIALPTAQMPEVETETVITPVPASAAPIEQAAANLGRSAPDCLYKYFDGNRNLLFAVARWNGPTGQKAKVLPVSWIRDASGSERFAFRHHPAPRPLYQLPELCERPHASVVVVEGEKCVEAAKAVFPLSVVVTSSGGSNGAPQTDWTPLGGRARVIIWPDLDAPGTKYAATVASILADLGVPEISIVDAQRLAEIDPDGKKRETIAGWDVADAIEEGHEPKKLRAAAVAAAQPFTKSTDGPVVATGWSAPMSIKSTLPPVEKFIPELLPDALRAYVLDVADRQQAPPDFAAVAAMCGIAAVVGNRIRIRPKRNDDWGVVPNLWGAIIGRPSAMKSPAMQAALAPLYAIQDDLRERWEEETKRAEIDDALSGLDAKDAKKKAEKALKDGDRDGARGFLAELIDGSDGDPPCPRIIINDATVEKLGELLNENPRGVLLIRDELPGFLARMENEEHQSERAFYLEAFNGDGRFTYDRIGRGTIHIEYSTVSIMGGVQPSRIAPIVRGAMSGASNDGLIQRLQMVVWPDDVGLWRWVDRTPNTLARLAHEKVFRDLYDLSIGDSDKPAVLRFSPAAQNLFREWMEEIQAEARGGSLPSTLESHILKMPKTVASLALLFELIDGGRSEVNEPATRRALGWAEYLRSHANRLYSSGETMAEDGARLIVERRHQLPEQFIGRNVHQKGWAGLGDRDTVAASIEILIATNHCREVNGMAATAGGRPTSLYFWNPALQAGG